MSSLPYEIVLISLITLGKKPQAAVAFNYHPDPPLTWKHVRDNIGSFKLAYKLRVPEKWCSLTLAAIETNNIIAALQNILVDEFLVWSESQQSGKAAQLPSLRVGGALQIILDTFFNTLPTTNLSHTESTTNKYEQEDLYLSQGKLRSVSVRYCKLQCVSYRDLDNTLSVGLGPLPDEQNTHFLNSHLPTAVLPLQLTDPRLLHNNESDVVRHSVPAFQQQLQSYNHSSLHINNNSDYVSSSSKNGSGVGVQGIVYRDLSQLVSIAIQQHNATANNHTNDAATSNSTTNNYGSSVAALPGAIAVSSELAEALELSLDRQTQLKQATIAQAKELYGNFSRNNSDNYMDYENENGHSKYSENYYRKQVKKAHRVANENAAFALHPQQTLLLPLLASSGNENNIDNTSSYSNNDNSINSSNNISKSINSNENIYTRNTNSVSQAVQSLVGRSDLLPVAREEFYHNSTNTTDDSVDTQNLGLGLQVQVNKGNSALYPRYFQRSVNINTTSTNNYYDVMDDCDSMDNNSGNTHKKQKKRKKGSKKRNFDDFKKNIDETTAFDSDNSSNSGNCDNNRKDNCDNYVLDVAPFLSSVQNSHSVSVHDTGLGSLGSGHTNSGGVTDRLCSASRTDAMSAILLLQSQRLHNDRKNNSNNYDSTYNNVADKRCRIISQNKHYSLKMRRPHSSVRESVLCNGVLRHSCDGTAISARDMALLFNADTAHPFPVTYHTNHTNSNKNKNTDTNIDDNINAKSTRKNRHTLYPASHTESLGFVNQRDKDCPDPELVNLILTQARDKLQRLPLLATKQQQIYSNNKSDNNISSSGNNNEKDDSNYSNDRQDVNNTSTYNDPIKEGIDYASSMCRLQGSLNASVAFSLALITQEMTDTLTQHWRRHFLSSTSSGEGSVAHLFAPLLTHNYSTYNHNNSNSNSNNDTAECDRHMLRTALLRSQVTHSLQSQTTQNCPGDLDSGYNRLTALLGHSFNAKNSNNSSDLMKTAGRDWVSRYHTQQHPLYIPNNSLTGNNKSSDNNNCSQNNDDNNSDNDDLHGKVSTNHDNNINYTADRVYYESDKRYIRSLRAQHLLGSAATPHRTLLCRPPANLKLLSVGHNYVHVSGDRSCNIFGTSTSKSAYTNSKNKNKKGIIANRRTSKYDTVYVAETQTQNNNSKNDTRSSIKIDNSRNNSRNTSRKRNYYRSSDDNTNSNGDNGHSSVDSSSDEEESTQTPRNPRKRPKQTIKNESTNSLLVNGHQARYMRSPTTSSF